MALSPQERHIAQERLHESTKVIGYYYDGMLSKQETIMKLMLINQTGSETACEEMIESLKSAYGGQ